MKTKISAAVLGLMLLVGTTAHAVPFAITGDGQSDTFVFNNSFDWHGNTYVLSSTAMFEVLNFDADTLELRITVANTTPLWQNGLYLGGGGGMTIHSLGWNQDPNATGITFADANDGGMTGAALNRTFPGFQTVDVCAYSGNCSGGSNQNNIRAGGFDVFNITLSGDFSGGSVTINPAYVKYMGNLGSYEFKNQVPEPGTLLLLGSGRLGLGILRRRRDS